MTTADDDAVSSFGCRIMVWSPNDVKGILSHYAYNATTIVRGGAKRGGATPCVGVALWCLLRVQGLGDCLFGFSELRGYVDGRFSSDFSDVSSVGVRDVLHV